jgi:hypothetical protein
MIKDIKLTNSNNEEICGKLKEKKSSEALIICCHGYKSSGDHPAIASITNKLYEMGHSMFVFNFSKSAQGANLMQQVSDIKDITAYFKNYKNIIILAGSFGALSGAIATPQIPKIKGLITVNGFFGSGKLGSPFLKEYILFRTAAIFNKSYKAVFDFIKSDYQPEKITIKTLVIYAKRDETVSPSQSKNFFKRAMGKKELYILEESDHDLTQEAYRQETAVVINDWLRSHHQQ